MRRHDSADPNRKNVVVPRGKVFNPDLPRDGKEAANPSRLYGSRTIIGPAIVRRPA